MKCKLMDKTLKEMKSLLLAMIVIPCILLAFIVCQVLCFANSISLDP